MKARFHPIAAAILRKTTLVSRTENDGPLSRDHDHLEGHQVVSAPIRFACDSCGRMLRGEKQLAGQKQLCPNCRATVVVPSSSDKAGKTDDLPTRTELTKSSLDDLLSGEWGLGGGDAGMATLPSLNISSLPARPSPEWEGPSEESLQSRRDIAGWGTNLLVLYSAGVGLSILLVLLMSLFGIAAVVLIRIDPNGNLLRVGLPQFLLQIAALCLGAGLVVLAVSSLAGLFGRILCLFGHASASAIIMLLASVIVQLAAPVALLAASVVTRQLPCATIAAFIVLIVGDMLLVLHHSSVAIQRKIRKASENCWFIVAFAGVVLLLLSFSFGTMFMLRISGKTTSVFDMLA